MTHLRDSIRHALAAVLMLGTLAGTVATFSNGSLTLQGAWERIVSVGGIAAALELGVIYCAWYIGQLDIRIQTARRRETITQLRGMQHSLYYWFYAVAAISAVANLIFRAGQLGNILLAAFVSVSPIVLVILFCIKLRPLPEDYQDIGARATGRALTRMVAQGERDVLRIMRRMGRGKILKDAEMRQLSFATSIIRVYARVEEANALDHALQLAAPAVEVDAQVWLRAEDLMHMYGVSRRSAQARMQRIPGRRHVPNSNAWEAPEAEVLKVCGPGRIVRERAQDPASGAQPYAVGALVPAVYTPAGEAGRSHMRGEDPSRA